MTDDRFRCICDPDDLFESPDPRPRAVEGCRAHTARRAAQQFAEKHGLTIQLVGDDHPDVDFPEHDCQDDDEDIPFELALCHYRPASAPNSRAVPDGE